MYNTPPLECVRRTNPDWLQCAAMTQAHGATTRSSFPMRHLPAFTLLLALSHAALAQMPTPSTDAERQAQTANALFAESCLAHYGDAKALGAWARGRGFGVTSPEMTRAVLQGDPGEVWSASNDVGDFLILLTPGGNCEVWARRADATATARLFDQALQHAQRPGRSFEREKDREIEAGGVKYRQVSYFMTQDSPKSLWAFIAIVADSDRAEVQVRLSADRVR